jgi:hypothetical protein
MCISAREAHLGPHVWEAVMMLGEVVHQRSERGAVEHQQLRLGNAGMPEVVHGVWPEVRDPDAAGAEPQARVEVLPAQVGRQFFLEGADHTEDRRRRRIGDGRDAHTPVGIRLWLRDGGHRGEGADEGDEVLSLVAGGVREVIPDR